MYQGLVTQGSPVKNFENRTDSEDLRRGKNGEKLPVRDPFSVLRRCPLFPSFSLCPSLSEESPMRDVEIYSDVPLSLRFLSVWSLKEKLGD